MWSFGLWDGTIVSLHVTANTQLTPKASLLSAPRFVAGQTVAVFYRTAGAGTSLVADRIYAGLTTPLGVGVPVDRPGRCGV